MSLVQCSSCKRNVLAKSDGTCPSCGAATSGAAKVDLAPSDPEQLAAWRRHDEEKRERAQLAARLRDRGRQLTNAGIGLAALALVVTIGSFIVAPGGMAIVWSGGVLAGAALAMRGRDLTAQARRLDDR